MEGTDERALLEKEIRDKNATLSEKEAELSTIESEIQVEKQEELGKEPEKV